MFLTQSQLKFPVNFMVIIMKALMNGQMVFSPTLSDNVLRINQLKNIGSCLMDQLMRFGLSQ